MTNHPAYIGHWGVCVNYGDNGVIVNVRGSDSIASSAVLSIDETKKMIDLLQKSVKDLESRQPGFEKCKYCTNEATKTLVWLKDKYSRSARTHIPWCGCDLMEALRKIWSNSYTVVEGVDYEVLSLNSKEIS